MKRKASRIIFGYRGNNYKFMSFFVGTTDNSFYFHIYRKPKEFPMKPKTRLPQKTEIIHFPDYQPTNFEENHISFHESGYILSKDNKGNRYGDGIIGIPFSEIESNLFILVVAPKNPTDMIESSKLDPERDIHIGLPEDAQPFALHFGIHRKSSLILPKLPHDDLFGGLIICGFNDKDFELLISMRKVIAGPRARKVEWPPFSLVLKRTG